MRLYLEKRKLFQNNFHFRHARISHIRSALSYGTVRVDSGITRTDGVHILEIDLYNSASGRDVGFKIPAAAAALGRRASLRLNEPAYLDNYGGFHTPPSVRQARRTSLTFTRRDTFRSKYPALPGVLLFFGKSGTPRGWFNLNYFSKYWKKKTIFGAIHVKYRLDITYKI